MSRNQRFGTLEPDIVGIGPIASANFINVPSAFSDDEGGARAFTFQHRVDRNGGPMHKRIDRIHIHTGLLQAILNSVFQGWRGGWTFGTQQPAGGGVVAKEIGEGSANINRDDKWQGRLR